jgi:hypothetical protein
MATRSCDLKVDFSQCKWATSDAEAFDLYPKKGIFCDVLKDLVESTDAPAIYHLASVLTTAVSALGKCTLYVGEEHRAHPLPLTLWTAVIGESGDRKSTAMERSVNSLRQGDPLMMLPTDASQEGWHLALSEQPVSLLYRDELSGLFDAAQRSYSQGLRSWLLETWAGADMIRKTLSKQETIIKRPRLSILGGIPPAVFSEKTTKSDWRSGFLARFIYFGGKREVWHPMQGGEHSGKYTSWLSKVALQSEGPIFLSIEVADPLLDWVYEQIEKRRGDHRPEVESALQRLQAVGFKLAAAYEMSLLDRPFGLGTTEQRITVSQNSIETIIPILTMLKRTTEHLFNDTNTTQDMSDEHSLLKIFENGKKYTRTEISTLSGLSYRNTTRILSDLLAADAIQLTIQHTTPPKAGPPFKMYSRKLAN